MYFFRISLCFSCWKMGNHILSYCTQKSSMIKQKISPLAKWNTPLLKKKHYQIFYEKREQFFSFALYVIGKMIYKRDKNIIKLAYNLYPIPTSSLLKVCSKWYPVKFHSPVRLTFGSKCSIHPEIFHWTPLKSRKVRNFHHLNKKTTSLNYWQRGK